MSEKCLSWFCFVLFCFSPLPFLLLYQMFSLPGQRKIRKSNFYTGHSDYYLFFFHVSLHLQIPLHLGVLNRQIGNVPRMSAVQQRPPLIKRYSEIFLKATDLFMLLMPFYFPHSLVPVPLFSSKIATDLKSQFVAPFRLRCLAV